MGYWEVVVRRDLLGVTSYYRGLAEVGFRVSIPRDIQTVTSLTRALQQMSKIFASDAPLFLIVVPVPFVGFVDL
jgi:hypothetical protein